MTLYIAHRGNFAGRNIELENSVEYVNNALSNGYNVEIDVRKIGNKLYLGHDAPMYEIELSYLQDDRLWCHSKTLETHMFLSRNNVHAFFHDQENYVFTNRGIKWTTEKTIDGIVVMPENNLHVMHDLLNKTLTPCGICSDDFRNLCI